jgi:hypothetical protein
MGSCRSILVAFGITGKSATLARTGQTFEDVAPVFT